MALENVISVPFCCLDEFDVVSPGTFAIALIMHESHHTAVASLQFECCSDTYRA